MDPYGCIPLRTHESSVGHSASPYVRCTSWKCGDGALSSQAFAMVLQRLNQLEPVFQPHIALWKMWSIFMKMPWHLLIHFFGKRAWRLFEPIFQPCCLDHWICEAGDFDNVHLFKKSFWGLIYLEKIHDVPFLSHVWALQILTCDFP